MVTYLKMAFFS